MKKIIVFIVLIFFGCSEKKDCDHINSVFNSDEFGFIYIENKGRSGYTYKMKVKSEIKDSQYIYSTNNIWPAEIYHILDRGDTLRKFKNDSVIYILKKDQIFEYKNRCGETYVNNIVFSEFLKKYK